MEYTQLTKEGIAILIDNSMAALTCSGDLWAKSPEEIVDSLELEFQENLEATFGELREFAVSEIELQKERYLNR